MKQYLDIVRNVLNKGQWKGNRTGVRTLTTFCEIFRHDMSEGFPLLTVRKMPIKSLLVELEGFINGITSKKWYQERGCKYWDYWANPKKVDKRMIGWQEKECHKFDNFKDCVIASDKLRKDFQIEEDDLGPLGYSHGWRNFGGDYTTKTGGYDQLKKIIETLKKDPNDRRMLCSAWNPLDLLTVALPSCHVLWNVVHINGKLNLVWFQRSNDFLIGNPSNIASYATLLLLICNTVDLVPGELVGIFSDCHIYENHIDNAKILLNRTPFNLPKVEIQSKDIFTWTHKDFKLIDYQYHPKLLFEVAV